MAYVHLTNRQEFFFVYLVKENVEKEKKFITDNPYLTEISINK